MTLNPGGPGGSGYLMPILHVLDDRNGNGKELNERYDLIGFDPRGVGYSTKLDCPDYDGGPSLGSSPITEDAARRYHDWTVRANRACAQRDPAFLGQLTTTNVARDMDRIRRGLGERRLSYLGISWGTWLGAVYRSLYPGKVQRMWLDSTALPDFRLDTFEAERSKAAADDFRRMAAWMAERNDTYGFGATGRQVEAAVAKLRNDLNARPKRFTDLPGEVFDGFMVAQSAAQPSVVWPPAAAILAALRDAPGDAPAPPVIKQVFSRPPDGGTPPADLPEEFNPTMNQAVFCNEDTGPRDFESAWAAYQKRLREHPVTGEFSMPINSCAGWPLPVRPVRLHRSDASLVMSGHRHEMPSPYAWTRQMQAAIGGSVLTVDDDVHGSTAGTETDCTPKLTAYFLSGKPGGGECRGVPVPTTTNPEPPTSRESAAPETTLPGSGDTSPLRPGGWR